MARKSYWMGVSIHSPASRAAVLSWLSPLCEGFTIESAQVLCDIETDREKKLKAVVLDESGKRKLATRTFGKNYSITLAPLRKPA